ncbi:MAG TPA: zinc-binding dehydrogenase [Gaiellaceae bacterium]
MRAAVLREVGGDLSVEEVADPEGDAVLTVRAAGVNFADLLIRRGLYPQMPELPYVLGSEVAGELDGRRVLAFTRLSGGGYAERAAVDPTWTFPLPEGASYTSGAAFLLTYLTAYVPVHHQARVTANSTVLVHAAAGGVGSAAVQLAKNLGARVVATASTAEKRAAAVENGADEALGYDDLDDVRADVVIDPVGGDVFTRSLSLLNPLGVVVAIGFADGLWQDPSVQWLVGRNAGVVGIYLARLMKLQPGFVHECALDLLGMWRRGEIDPVVGACFPLDDAADAHALIAARRNVGKVVLEP